MKYGKVALGILIVGAQALFLAACATSEGTGQTFTINDPYALPEGMPAAQSVESRKYVAPAPSSTGASAISAAGSMMKHNLRQIVEYDTYKMTKLVNREINMKEEDSAAFLDQVAVTLGQTVFLQPHFTEREVALRELKGKIDQEDYIVVLRKAADDLLNIFNTSPSPSDQAGATIALTNLVIEVKSMKRPELKDILQKIADAKLKPSDEAKHYAVESMQALNSPSKEAQLALKTL